MKFDFSSGTVTLALACVDLRKGFGALSALAASELLIDVEKCQDWVVFINRTRKVAKIIHRDDRGNLLITRHLDEGTFQQILTRADGRAKEPLTAAELESYLDGKHLLVRRTTLLSD